MIKNIFISMRPRQWTKNLIIFAGLIFSQNLGHPLLLSKTIIAFVLFCAISGAVYIINDLLDYRYLYLIYRKDQGEQPETALLTDGWLLSSVVVYVLAVWLIIYQ